MRCTARVLRRMASELVGYPPPQGLPELRQQIAAHLAATRGLLADPACIIVTGGTQQALHIAADLLLDPVSTLWVEDPGYIAGRGSLLAAGAETLRSRATGKASTSPPVSASRLMRGSRWWPRRIPRRSAARAAGPAFGVA